jgi:hypothetical protein
MSLTSATAFLRRLSEDDDFLLICAGLSEVSAIEAGRQHGYSFTSAEFETARRDAVALQAALDTRDDAAVSAISAGQFRRDFGALN